MVLTFAALNLVSAKIFFFVNVDGCALRSSIDNFLLPAEAYFLNNVLSWNNGYFCGIIEFNAREIIRYDWYYL